MFHRGIIFYDFIISNLSFWRSLLLGLRSAPCLFSLTFVVGLVGVLNVRTVYPCVGAFVALSSRFGFFAIVLIFVSRSHTVTEELSPTIVQIHYYPLLLN